MHWFARRERAGVAKRCSSPRTPTSRCVPMRSSCLCCKQPPPRMQSPCFVTILGPATASCTPEPLAVVLPETIDPNLLPVVDLPVEHQKLIERLLRLNRPVNINIDVENSFTGGPVVSNNVVGEIPGTIRPEEVVLLSAHLDSWDLGTGATDDGFGTAAVLGAAQSHNTGWLAS